MKGFVYLDNDWNLSVRTKEFIDELDPGFWTRNSHVIDTVWEFDSENMDSMRRLLNAFKARELRSIKVEEFCNQIGFNLAEFLKTTRVVQPLFSNPSS